MTTTTQLKNFTQTRSHISSRDLKPSRTTPVPSNAKTKRSTRNTLVFSAVVLAHLLIIFIVFKLSTVLPIPPVPEQPMMVSLLEDAPIAPIVEQVSAESKPQHEEQKRVPKPQPKKVVKPQAPQNDLLVAQEPTTHAQTSEVKVSQESTATPVVHTDAADTKTTSDVATKTVKETEVKEDIVEPPRFGVAYLNNPKPNYPNLSRRAGEQGRVLFKVLVGANGEPESVEIAKTSGFDRLDQAGLEAVKQWRFVPAKRNNQAISAYVNVPVSFSLDR